MTLDELTPFWLDFRSNFRGYVERRIPEALVEDVLSDTYLQIARMLPGYQHISKSGLYAFMLKTLHFCCRTEDGKVRLRKQREPQFITSFVDDDGNVYHRDNIGGVYIDEYGEGISEVRNTTPDDLTTLLDDIPLTRREREYLMLMLDDMDDTRIAEHLALTYKAIRNLRDRAMERLRAFGRAMQLQPNLHKQSL